LSDIIDPVELSQALVRRPSVTPEDEGALALVQEALEGLGFTCHPLTFEEEGYPAVKNLYARIGNSGPNFCFAGHTDVVPIVDLEAWTHGPFDAEIVDGRLYGRGTADMKAAVACFVSSSQRFIEAHGKDFGGSISLLITGDEEGDAVNGTVKVLDWLMQQGETLDTCLVGEPTNPETLGDMVKIGRRGSLNATITVHGSAGHTGYPHLADNPIPGLMKMLTRIIETPLDDGNEHFQATTIAISTFDVGNPTTNVIPGTAKATFNIRFNDMHTGDSLKVWIKEQCDHISGEYDLDISVSGESFLTPPGPLSKLIQGAVKDVTGKVPELSTTGGTSDARFIKNHCPVAEFGMAAKTMHKVDENVVVSDIRDLADIYTKILDGYFPK
jgi:succinyl-diaminopimelate desuccinylase